MENGSPRYAFVGYSTVYEYYAYPENIRPRIAQMVVLPPFQRKGIGAQLLDTIYKHYCANKLVIDMTVEDPSENFQRLRDFVDCKNCLQLECFKGKKILDGLTNIMTDEAHSKLRINKKQIRRVYEILRLKATDIYNEAQYKKYRLFVKNRLNAPYRKEDDHLKRLKKLLHPDEFRAATMTITSKEQRMENLESQYMEAENEYNVIIKRLQMANIS